MEPVPHGLSVPSSPIHQPNERSRGLVLDTLLLCSEASRGWVSPAGPALPPPSGSRGPASPIWQPEAQNLALQACPEQHPLPPSHTLCASPLATVTSPTSAPFSSHLVPRPSLSRTQEVPSSPALPPASRPHKPPSAGALLTMASAHSGLGHVPSPPSPRRDFRYRVYSEGPRTSPSGTFLRAQALQSPANGDICRDVPPPPET